MVIEDATGGIEVKTAAGNLFEIYPQGVTVTVNCNGLTLGSYGGSPQLGFGTGDYEAGLIPAYDLEWRVADAGLPQVDIPARTLGLPELSMRYMNCWVRIADVQFAAEELGLHWGDADQTVERHLVDHAGDTLAVRVLRGAMTGTPLPQGSGFAEGILGWFNGSFNLRPVSAGHAVMNSPRF